MQKVQTQSFWKIGGLMNSPKYEAGSVIDLRFTRDTMPDRIYINMVYRKVGSKQWMYEVLSEKSDGVLYMQENDIFKVESQKKAKCYDNEIVKKLYSEGFRFCGNMKETTAFNRANTLKSANYIKHIILANAISQDDYEIDDHLGLWVMYNTQIDENTKEINKNESGMYQIK